MTETYEATPDERDDLDELPVDLDDGTLAADDEHDDDGEEPSAGPPDEAAILARLKDADPEAAALVEREIQRRKDTQAFATMSREELKELKARLQNVEEGDEPDAMPEDDDGDDIDEGRLQELIAPKATARYQVVMRGLARDLQRQQYSEEEIRAELEARKQDVWQDCCEEAEADVRTMLQAAKLTSQPLRAHLQGELSQAVYKPAIQAFLTTHAVEGVDADTLEKGIRQQIGLKAWKTMPEEQKTRTIHAAAILLNATVTPKPNARPKAPAQGGDKVTLGEQKRTATTAQSPQQERYIRQVMAENGMNREQAERAVKRYIAKGGKR